MIHRTCGFTRDVTFLAFAVFITLFLLSRQCFSADFKYSGQLRYRWFSDSRQNILSKPPVSDRVSSFSDMRFNLKLTFDTGAVAAVTRLDLMDNDTGYGNRRFGSKRQSRVGVKEGYMMGRFSRGRLILGRKNVRFGHGLLFSDELDTALLSYPFGNIFYELFYGRVFETDSTSPVKKGRLTGAGISYLRDSEAGFYFLRLSDGEDYLDDKVPGISFAGFYISSFYYRLEGVASGLGHDDISRLYGELEKGMHGFVVTAAFLAASGSDNLQEPRQQYIAADFNWSNILLNSEKESKREGGNASCPESRPLPEHFCGGIISFKLGAKVYPHRRVLLDTAFVLARLKEPVPYVSALLNDDKSMGAELDINILVTVTDNFKISVRTGYFKTSMFTNDIFKALLKAEYLF